MLAPIDVSLKFTENTLDTCTNLGPSSVGPGRTSRLSTSFSVAWFGIGTFSRWVCGSQLRGTNHITLRGTGSTGNRALE